MSRKNKRKPIPFRLSQWNNANEVLYQCPDCGTSFQILADQELFCHGCGLFLDWSDSPRYCSDEFKKLYWDADKKVLESMSSTDEVYRDECKREQLDLLWKYYRGKLR